MSKELCQNRTYQTKIISHIPHKYRFADGSKSLVVDYATTDQLDQCRKIIEEAAARGDNVGLDEYENGSEEKLFDTSEVFQASDPVSGSIQAFVFIQPCLYQRSHDTCAASVYVFRTKDIDDGVYAELMSLAADFARDIDIGYTQCLTQVALCLQGLYLQLRRSGFITVAVLPNWINIAGNSFKDNALMVKDFGMPEKLLRSPMEVLKMWESRLSTDILEKYERSDIPQIPGLPKRFLLENGMKLVLRNARKDEDELVYEMLKDASEKGAGYSVHEFPSLKMFRVEFLVSGYLAAIEDENTNKLIGFVSYRDAGLYRGGKGKILEGAAIIAAGLRGKGFGHASQSIGHCVLSLLGCERVLVDTFNTNTPTLRLWKHDGMSVCGVLPKGGFQKGVGWVDMVLCVHHTKSEFPRLHKL